MRSFTVIGFFFEPCRADTADADAVLAAWAHRSGSLLLVCHGMWMNPGSEGHLFNLVVPPSVVRSYHLHTRNEADMRVRPSANQGIRSSVTELLGAAL